MQEKIVNCNRNPIQVLTKKSNEEREKKNDCSLQNLLSTFQLLKNNKEIKKSFGFFSIFYNILFHLQKFSELERQELNDKLQKMYQEKSDW